MARNLTPSMSAKDEQEFGIMPLSPSTPSTLPPLNQSAKSPLSNVFKPSGYEHLHHDDRDDIGSPQPDNDPSSPQASTNSLGIYPDEKIRTSSVRRKPIEPKSPEITSASEAASPDSNCHLLDSPLSLDGRSPRPPTWRGMRMPGIAEKLWSWSRTTLPGLRPTATSGQPGAANNNSSSSLDPDTEIGDHSDEERFYKKYSEPPTACRSREDIGRDRNIMMMIVSLYSTAVSGLWFFVACFQPRWGKTIRTGGPLEPSVATTLTTIVAKSIEISFVASFAWCAGQQLTRRAYSKKNGLTLAEICMRGWINKPGAWVVNWEAFWYGGRTVVTHRTILMFLATLGATLYTPASDAMVSPKLKFSPWRNKVLSGPVYSSYANPGYVREMCPAMFDTTTGSLSKTESCINVQFSGESYMNMIAFMRNWTNIYKAGTSKADGQAGRPAGTSLLYGAVTMEGAWIETQYSNVTTAFEKYGRIVNNVTMAMPHPGVVGAAMQDENEILQPQELGGIGQYSIRAGVVSPAVNVLCVNVLAEEIAPLVYTTWPNSTTKKSDVFSQLVPQNETDWVNDVPSGMVGEEPYYYNRTELDDLFRWGPKYKRRPPIFPAYPNQYNFISSKPWEVWGPDAIYLLAKSPNITHYTVCEARSWVTPACSTRLDVAGTTGWTMKAHCEDENDQNAYHRSFRKDQQWPEPNADWKNLAEEWRRSLDLNGGQRNSNSSNGNVLTKTILKEKVLPVYVPSLSEMLAVLLASTTVLGSVDTPFVHSWDYKTPGNILKDAILQKFNATMRSEEYTSGHTRAWQGGVWYPVLGVVFVLNCFCFAYIWGHAHTLTDFTENENLFTLAINSPPSSQFNGSCGGGPKKRDFVVPWKVSYAEKENHYYFEAANERPWRGRYSKKGRYSSGETPQLQGDNYKRLSTSKVWL